MRPTHTAWILLAILLIAGCSSSEPNEVVQKSDSLNSPLASTEAVVTSFEKTDSVAASTDEPVSPFEENLDFFTPPKLVVPVEVEEPVDDGGGALPPLRLVGFIGAAGDKAMMAVDDKMHIVTAGKRLNGVEIVSVQSPNVELRWGEMQLKLDFYQPRKSDRGQANTKAVRSSSPPTLSRADTYSNRPPRQNATGRPISTPRPPIALPSLPGLPMPGNVSPADMSIFPDLSAGPGPPPAP